jgi:hypothetical protein
MNLYAQMAEGLLDNPHAVVFNIAPHKKIRLLDPLK